MNILDEIRAHKQVEVAEREARRPLGELIGLCQTAARGSRFAESLRSAAGAQGIALIAEVKRRSPAAGDLQLGADGVALGASYVAAGAAAVSVLTDERFFSGSDDDLTALRSAVRAALLRKDFTLSSYQIYEARALGADAVLLIASMLADAELNVCMDAADCLGMDAIVEVHSEEEARRAVALRAPIIGINNRDLSNFQVDLATTARLRALIPGDRLVISESGIASRTDVERAQAAGAQAVLVGEALVRAEDPSAKVRELLGLASSPLPLGEAGRSRAANEHG